MLPFSFEIEKVDLILTCLTILFFGYFIATFYQFSPLALLSLEVWKIQKMRVWGFSRYINLFELGIPIRNFEDGYHLQSCR